MMDRQMVFSPVVDRVGGAWPQKVPEFPLCIPVSQPVEPHVHGFRGFRGDAVGGDAMCCRIICLHGSSWLWVSQFNKFCPYGTANFVSMNSAPNSASAAELITALMICKKFRTAPLPRGMSLSLDMKKCPPLGFFPWLLIGMKHCCGLRGSYLMLGR